MVPRKGNITHVGLYRAGNVGAFPVLYLWAFYEVFFCFIQQCLGDTMVTYFRMISFLLIVYLNL